MTPVDQTTFGPVHGNCFSACVASILDLPISEVPFFMGPVVDGKGWWDRFCDWCATRGVVPVYYGCTGEGSCPGWFPSGYSILTGRSPRAPEGVLGRYHAVVALDGVMVHDPHVGDRRGVTSVLDYITVEWGQP